MDIKEFNRIRAEIKRRRLDLIAQGENENNALNIARKEANDKYGKGWREKLIQGSALLGKSKNPTVYVGHVYGEHWRE